MHNPELHNPEQYQDQDFNIVNQQYPISPEHQNSVETLAYAQCELFLKEESEHTGYKTLPSSEAFDPNKLGKSLEQIYMACFEGLKNQGLLADNDLNVFAKAFVDRYRLGSGPIVKN